VKKYWTEWKGQWDEYKLQRNLTKKNKNTWGEKELAYEKYFSEFVPLSQNEIVNTYNHGILSNLNEVFFYGRWKNPRHEYENLKPSTIGLPAIDTSYFDNTGDEKKYN
jgi:hypothetical protein